MVSPALPLLTSSELCQARRLIESQGLAFEEGCDEIVGIYQAGRLAATAARAGYVLKMFAVGEALQGSDALGVLTTALVGSGRRAGHDSVFVYTRPQHAGSFEACGFRLLVAAGEVALLEHGNGLERYLRACTAKAGLPAALRPPPDGRTPGTAAAIVVNGNPFTLGHRYLAETAAARVERVYLFVVREDRSVFPFDLRFRMALEATRHLANLVLLDTSRYAVSAGTFPSYFLRQDDERARAQMRVDASLFGARVAPALRIGSRFVGDEPYCPTTASYNAVLGDVLPRHGVALEVVPRLGAAGGGFVSATRVRAALASRDWDTVARMVPDTTMALLRGAEGLAIADRLAGSLTP